VSTPHHRKSYYEDLEDELAETERRMADRRRPDDRGAWFDEERTDSIDGRSDDAWDNWGVSESGYEQSWGPGQGNDRLDWSRYHLTPHKDLDAAAHDRLDETARDRLDETGRDLLDRAARDQLDMSGGSDLGTDAGY
jgi:hypothetical protein